jgi:hypothetical protein
MARGSSGGASGGSGGGISSGTEMLQSAGQIDNSGKYTVSRKYYVTNENELITTPANISVGGKTMLPSSLSYQKIAGGVWEKTIEYTAPLQSTDTGVVRKLSSSGNAQQEGRLEMDVSADRGEIEKHPEKDFLMKNYNGRIENNKLVFPETYTEQGTGTSGGTPKPNPLFGVRYYWKPAATVRHTYTRESISGDIWKGVFCIVDTDKLPGQFPPFPEYTTKDGTTLKHHWMIGMPQIAIVGGRYEITDTYKLLDLMTDSAAAALNKIAAT